LLLLSVYFLFKISGHIVIEKIRNGYLKLFAGNGNVCKFCRKSAVFE
jgi:hypothetical protein